MKRLILVIMIIMMLATAGMVPQAVYGFEYSDLGEFLTREERLFYHNVERQCSQVMLMCDYFIRLIELDYRNVQDIESYYIHFARLKDCGIESSPLVFENARVKLNSEVCPALVTLHGKVYSCFSDAMGDPDEAITSNRLKKCLRALRPECERVYSGAAHVWDLTKQTTEDLIDKRKDVREKAKPLLEEGKKIIKKDAEEKKKNDKNAGSSEDSDDLFDMDCFIATAAYGTPTAVEINILREFRDEYLVDSLPGEIFVKTYYKISPPIADVISETPIVRLIVREVFIDPLVYMVELTKPIWN